VNYKVFMKYLVLIFIIFFITYYFVPSEPEKRTKKNERYYQTKMCNHLGGQVEYLLVDKSRVDCLTEEYAIEVDWAKKWAEGVGQSLYYAHMTNRKPAIGLIVGKKDKKHVKKLKSISDKFAIKIIFLKKIE